MAKLVDCEPKLGYGAVLTRWAGDCEIYILIEKIFFQDR